MLLSVNSGGFRNLKRGVQKGLKHVKECIQSIETERGSKLEYFYIGKTHGKQRRGRYFDHMDQNTWRLDDGINGRFRQHNRCGYGCDGLVVLTVVTREAIHPKVCSNKPNFHQLEHYALALENRLIQDFLSDRRLYNDTLEPGRRVSCPVGYPLYMAFKVR